MNFSRGELINEADLIKALEDAGIAEGDTVNVLGIEFDFMY